MTEYNIVRKNWKSVKDREIKCYGLRELKATVKSIGLDNISYIEKRYGRGIWLDIDIQRLRHNL